MVTNVIGHCIYNRIALNGIAHITSFHRMGLHQTCSLLDSGRIELQKMQLDIDRDLCMFDMQITYWCFMCLARHAYNRASWIYGLWGFMGI